jgi:hypothetical protein
MRNKQQARVETKQTINKIILIKETGELATLLFILIRGLKSTCLNYNL